MTWRMRPNGWGLVCLIGITTVGGSPAEAGGFFKRRARPVAPTVVQAPATPVVAPVAVPTSGVVGGVPTGLPSGSYASAPPAPMLGTFYPTPYMAVRGNAPAGGGYSPLGMYGDTSLTEYGPLSSLRSQAAPVQMYGRGYNGVVYETRGVSSSYPMLPAASPVIYPTQANYAFGFRESRTPPWWKSAENWVDQN